MFCLRCLNSYFTLLITEGLVRSVCCPGVECVRTRVKWERENVGGVEEGRPGEVGEEELRGIVGVELTERYGWLKEKHRVESGAPPVAAR